MEAGEAEVLSLTGKELVSGTAVRWVVGWRGGTCWGVGATTVADLHANLGDPGFPRLSHSEGKSLDTAAFKEFIGLILGKQLGKCRN